MSALRHCRAILLLPFLVTVVVPATILLFTGTDTFDLWQSFPAARVGLPALGGLFDVILTAADIERGKPDPACYLAAAAKLRVAPAECVVLEDTVSGVRAAVAAGMACVGVQTGRLADRLIAEGVRHIVPDFTTARLDLPGGQPQLRLASGFTIRLASGFTIRVQQENGSTMAQG